MTINNIDRDYNAVHVRYHKKDDEKIKGIMPERYQPYGLSQFTNNPIISRGFMFSPGLTNKEIMNITRKVLGFKVKSFEWGDTRSSTTED